MPHSRSASARDPPHIRPGTLSASGRGIESREPKAASPANMRCSSSVTRKSLEHIRVPSGCLSTKDPRRGVIVTTTSHPRSSSLSMHVETDSARSAVKSGISSITTSERFRVREASCVPSVALSTSRRKQGLLALSQKTSRNPKIDSAYSRARAVFPKPDGATRKRTTSRF